MLISQEWKLERGMGREQTKGMQGKNQASWACEVKEEGKQTALSDVAAQNAPAYLGGLDWFSKQTS